MDLLESRFERDPEAMAYLDSLHPAVKRMLEADAPGIRSREDLISAANRYMTEALREFGGIYDDSDTYPD